MELLGPNRGSRQLRCWRHYKSGGRAKRCRGAGKAGYARRKLSTTGFQYMSYDRYGKTSHKDGFGSSFIIAGSALKTNDLGGIANARVDLFGADLHDFMIRAKRGLTRIGTFGEDLPNIENRIDAEAVWNANFEEGLK